MWGEGWMSMSRGDVSLGGHSSVLLEVLLGVRVLSCHPSSWLRHLPCLTVGKIYGLCGHLADSAGWRCACACAWQAC